MITAIVTHAPMIGLLFFFTTFVGIAVWLYATKSGARTKRYAEMPLKEDRYGQS